MNSLGNFQRFLTGVVIKNYRLSNFLQADRDTGAQFSSAPCPLSMSVLGKSVGRSSSLENLENAVILHCFSFTLCKNFGLGPVHQFELPFYDHSLGDE